MGCRAAAKSKVVVGCGRGQLEVASWSRRCNEVIIELPSETTIVQKLEDRGSSGSSGTEEEEEEEELAKGRGSWTSRSRTPTGAEMKSQSSLEVPKQVRSASFDEIQLEAKRQDDVRDARSTRTTSSSSSSCSPARSQDSSRGRRSATLRVPQLQSTQRSKSFDVCERSYGSSSSQQSLGSMRRPDTPTIQVSGCYHCACVEEYRNLYLSRDDDDPSSREELDDEAEDVDDTSEDEDSDLVDRSEGSPEIRVTLTTFTEREHDLVPKPVPEAVPTTIVPEIVPEVVREELSDISEVRGGLFPERQRRRSIASPKLARQEALTSYPVELPTLVSSTEDEEKAEDEEEEEDVGHAGSSKCKFVVRDIFLTVPELKRDRAASVDSCFNNKNGHGEDTDTLTVPQQNIRSKSDSTSKRVGTSGEWDKSFVPNTLNFLNVPRAHLFSAVLDSV
ncbi:Eye-specific diacylglycerol kinase [Eufriesea mexicana]|uniref:Eye-specific diacylglycerol kinase n=1 Tax=Eufriesea mexicana TaxID=516756 RepID=A0A310S592_9HYME|nr:Eye-specific diacylglycerol kinase [Eufriesea mexicana]